MCSRSITLQLPNNCNKVLGELIIPLITVTLFEDKKPLRENNKAVNKNVEAMKCFVILFISGSIFLIQYPAYDNNLATTAEKRKENEKILSTVPEYDFSFCTISPVNHIKTRHNTFQLQNITTLYIKLIGTFRKETSSMIQQHLHCHCKVGHSYIHTYAWYYSRL